MMKGFVAYSKADSKNVEGLMIHLKGLEHEGIIETWHDRQLVPGDEWDSRIHAELADADIIVFCVSADLLATDYVQRVEIPTAIARHDREEATVIPVIFRKCAWQGHALGRLQGIPPKDKTVQDYIREDNMDEIWTDVANAVRDAVQRREEADVHSRPAQTRREAPPESWVRPSGAKPVIFSDHGEASDLERDDFVRSTFASISEYFEASLENLKEANPSCEVRLQELSADAFEASVYVNGRRSAFCGIFTHRDMGAGGIGYSNRGVGQRNAFNEDLRLASGERGSRLKWQALMGTMHGASEFDTNEMDQQKASAYLWSLFMQRL